MSPLFRPLGVIQDDRENEMDSQKDQKSVPPKAIVLLSGGLDSSTVAVIAKSEGFEIHALTFRYGQRHDAEIEAAKKIAEKIGAASHMIAQIDSRLFEGSTLTGGASVPKDRPVEEMAEGIPSTYVPARNTIFLSHALALAEVNQSVDIFIGVNALDFSGYPDCRPEYIAAYEKMANLATKAGVEGETKLTIHTPLIDLTKAQIIAKGLEIGVDYSLTRTCYDPSTGGAACGQCDACQLRLKGFSENGIEDPAPYQQKD